MKLIGIETFNIFMSIENKKTTHKMIRAKT